MVAASVAGSTKMVAPTTMPTILAASAQDPTWRTSPASRWLPSTVPTLARGRAGRHAIGRLARASPDDIPPFADIARSCVAPLHSNVTAIRLR